MATAAQHLTVGGLLTFDLLLADVPSPVRIISVSASLLARYTIRSVERPTIDPQYASKKTRLFIIDANHLPCSDDTELLVKGNERLPLTTNLIESPGGCCIPAAETPQVLQQTKDKDKKQTRKSGHVYPGDTPLQVIEAGGSFQVYPIQVEANYVARHVHAIDSLRICTFISMRSTDR